MHVSTRRLLQGAIDYAGIFPPARLSMVEAVSEYAALTRGEDRWIVSRFACSTSRLDELRQALAKGMFEGPVAVTAIGTASTDQETWEAALVHDAEAMNRFQDRMGGKAEIEAFEIRAPGHADLDERIRDLRGFADAEVYVELPLGEGLEDSLALLAETEWLGAKVRTGGLEAAAFPDAWNLAGFVRQCIDLELPFKMTAGLHHALPHPDESIGATMHGFVNVLGGTALAIAEDLSQRELERLFLDADRASWTFSDDGLSWRGRRAGLAEIDEARSLFVAFGSCSVKEPLEGLAALGT